MANPDAANGASIMRLLPSVDELIRTETGRRLAGAAGSRRVAALARKVTDAFRDELRKNSDSGVNSVSAPTKEGFLEALGLRLESAWRLSRDSRVRHVINATGVIVHTNLGRAPLSKAAVAAVANEAGGYCTLEYDRGSRKRGRRAAYAESLVAELTGAEAAVIVNNCAAAAFLVLSVYAAGREVIVSRGELVEIGGDFRVPDVLVRSGAMLCEVGTTNRTKISDYEKAVGENTAMILRVHPSNYRIIGFTETPPLEDLAKLARRNKILLFEDAGSGALVDLRKFGLADEPVISKSVTDGAHIVTFSGDKLLGGPQAGIIVGRQDLIDQIRKHPLYRVLRVDKLISAALEATLEAYARETSESDVPVLKMLGLSAPELAERSREFVLNLSERVPQNTLLGFDVIEGNSAIGGGAAPDVQPATSLIALSHAILSAAEIEESLRSSEPPVIARIADDRVLLDLRTVSEPEEGELLDAIAEIAASSSHWPRQTAS